MVSSPARASQPPLAAPARLRRWCDGWLDGIAAGWGVGVFLVVFVAAWMVFLSLAYQGADLHPDVIEAWELGQRLDWGYAKHPPLMAWIAGLWSAVFPATDWSLQLLAMTNAAAGLWAVDLIARRLMGADKRAVVLLLLLLLPAYHFHAQRFSANTVLLPLWPLATYAFLRSFETRRPVWAIAAGVTAALAMLGKYYSVFLLAGFAVAACLHPARRAYWGSRAPWLSALAGAVVLAPHIVWLVATGAEPFGYALTMHSGLPRGDAFRDAAFFLVGVGAYLALPALIWWLMVRDDVARLRPRRWHRLDPALQLLGLIFLGTIALPFATSLALRSSLPALWTLQGLFLPVVIVVAEPAIAVERSKIARLAAGIALSMLGVVLAAPVHAWYRNTHPFHEQRNYFRLAATELTRDWRARSGEPMPYIRGEEDLSLGIAFYSPDHPLYPGFFGPQLRASVTVARLASEGWAAACFDANTKCVHYIEEQAAIQPNAVLAHYRLVPTLWGHAGTEATVSAVLVPPAGEAKRSDGLSAGAPR